MDPDLIRNILSINFTNFHDRPFYIDEESDPLGAHLVFLQGEKWKITRTKLTPTFTSGKMKMMFHTLLSCSKSLGTILDEHIKTKEALDIKDIFARLTTDTIGSCAFGLDCNSLKDPETEFRRYGKKVFSFNFRDAILNFLANNCPFILRLFKIPLTSPDITDFFMNALKQTVDYREKNNVHRRDFLDLLIRLKNNQSVLDDPIESKAEGSGGMRFAILQIKIVLASVLKDYKFTLDSKTVTPIRFDPKSIFLSPVDTILLQASKCEI
ncbi:Cytochrome P450 6a18 [Carabus blaptoides fortunei]